MARTTLSTKPKHFAYANERGGWEALSYEQCIPSVNEHHLMMPQLKGAKIWETVDVKPAKKKIYTYIHTHKHPDRTALY